MHWDSPQLQRRCHEGTAGLQSRSGIQLLGWAVCGSRKRRQLPTAAWGDRATSPEITSWGLKRNKTLCAVFFLFQKKTEKPNKPKKDVDGCSLKRGHFCMKRNVVLRTYQIATKSMKTNGAKKHLIINRSGYRYTLRVRI